MSQPFFRLLAVLAGSTQSELRRQLQYLKAENEILRSRLGCRVVVTASERARLTRLARAAGPAIRSLVSIVAPGTIMRWMNAAAGKGNSGRRFSPRRSGRPRTLEDVRALILRLARETGWGYTRILGETSKLGVVVSRSTVVNTLRAAGVPPATRRAEPTWEEFLRAHASTLWACDFMSRRILTPRGVRFAFVLVFIHVASRRAMVSRSTLRPNAAWVSHQAAQFAVRARASGGTCRVLLRDNDSKFGEAFDSALRAASATPVRLPHLAPNLNAHVERLIQTIQCECLDRFIAIGTGHLDHLVREFVDHYNLERPHSGIGFRAPAGQRCSGGDTPVGRVLRRSRLGGTLNHYVRAAA